MPTIPELVYAALLYKDGASPASPQNKDFAQAETADGGKLKFSFQRPEDTSGTFTLEIFAFVKTDVMAEGDETPQFSREIALLSEMETELAIDGDKIVVEKAIALSSDKPGTVSLKIKIPTGCSLEINGTANFNCEKDESSSDTYILTQKDENEILAGAYQVTFTVRKDSENREIVHIFSEYINVINGLCTDTWSGLAKGAAKDVTNGMSKTVYVRGADGWYDGSEYKDTATASDDNSGSFLAPLATIQKAVEKIIAINDGESEYTIFVDGTSKCDENTYIGENGMADFSKLAQNLTLTIKALSGTATLDGGAQFDENGNVTAGGIGKRVIYAKPERGILTLTLDNLVITGGNTTENGGGVYFSSSKGTLTMNGGEISRNKAADGGGLYDDYGGFTMTAGTISGNTATHSGGGIYSNSAYNVTISGSAIIRKNTAGNSGGGLYIKSGSLDVKGGTISGNVATNDGGGICFSSSLSAHTLEISGGTIGGASETDKNKAKNGGGVFVFGKLKMSSGSISGNTATSDGGGVYVGKSSSISVTFTMTAGTISGNTASASGGGVYVSGGLSASGTFAMTGGTISGNSATKGNGAYLASTGKLNMSDAAQFAESDDMYLAAFVSDIPTITVAGALNAESSPVATITPSAYTAGRQVLSADGDVEITPDVCRQFALTADPDSGEWEIIPDDNGAAGVLGIDAVYLNSSSGSDTKSGLTASNAVKTLSTAIELFDSKYAQKIMVCYRYDLPIEERDLLNREGKRHLMLMRYDGSSDDSGKCTDTLLRINQGDVTITNVTLDGNKENVGETQLGRLLYISSLDTVVTLGDGATVRNNWLVENGGGVFVTSGTFILKGGKITRNETSYYGGGIYLYDDFARFEMIDGEISENTAGSFSFSGGGVFVSYDKNGDENCKFTMSGGVIRDNKAGQGGGVYVKAKSGSSSNVDGSFMMTGGKIINNTATYSSGYGGGVYVGGRFTMSGGEITGNTAPSAAGVYQTGTFNISGAAKVESDNDVYLADGRTICVAGALTAAPPVATITLFNSDYTAERKVLSADADWTIDQTVCDTFALTNTDWEIVPSNGYGVLEAK